MKIILTASLAMSLGLISCGPDNILVDSGISHTCTIKELDEKISADPDNMELKKEYEEAVNSLRLVIETAEEGDREALKNAIQEGAKEGCK